MTDQSVSTQELVSWTHLWFAGAVQTAETLDARWDDEDPAGSIGARDALTLVLIDAIRNVVRGSERTLGVDHPALRAFGEAQPSLKDFRDRLEHFDDYLLGTGFRQDKSVPPPPLPMRFVSSSGNDGHTVYITVHEKTGAREYRLDTASAIADARTLMLSLLVAEERDDEQHQARCWLCRPGTRRA